MSRTRPFSTRALFIAGAALAIGALSATPARAQLNGENLLGDNGVRSGTQPTPGFYTAVLFYRSYADTIKDPSGNRITLDPTRPASQTINVAAPLAIYVSKAKIFGAHYGAMAVVPFANATLEAPAFGFTENVSGQISDVYVVPLQLGWHWSRADAVASFGFFAPTGHYTAGGSGNIGRGMWSYEIAGGTTVYVDRQRTWSIAGTAYWETHTTKQGTDGLAVGPATLSGVKVGQILTVEGGAAKEFLHGAASVGVAYYAQWKLTDDELGFPVTSPGAPEVGKHRVFAVGPDVTIPIATKTRLVSLVNVRYLWEAGAEAKTQGQSLVITWTVPVPGVKIPASK